MTPDERAALLVRLIESVGFRVHENNEDFYIYTDGTKGPYGLSPVNAEKLGKATLRAIAFERREHEQELKELAFSHAGVIPLDYDAVEP